MRTHVGKETYLKDYVPSDYLIKKAELFFDLDFDVTRVRSRLHIHKNHQGKNRPLHLNGEGLELHQVWLDERELEKGEYECHEFGLTLFPEREHFFVEIENTISPRKNTALEGLYKAGEVLLTQCEPHGFRRITYFNDRPDNMCVYTARLEGDKGKFPYLLCNGNFISRGDLPNNRHFVQWEDPFHKPSYLFALVAGDFHRATDSFHTKSGRRVELELYVDRGEEKKCTHALESLKKAMKWDEDTYGLEYDLDLYMIVATNYFNMGAMENKGLNIFNSVYVLADPQTATDNDYDSIESVIGHEYFHNWSGNRVTCRDWFQLTLKEGLTVYRDQEFSRDLHDATVKRIFDVERLREAQFPEDDGPNKHPIRPEHYLEINNFYTATIYEKGAEVIRMVETLLGLEKFKKGLRLYFERHDGEAATCEDFIQAMADSSGVDLDLFKQWYSQAGTPLVEIKEHQLNDFFEWSFYLTSPHSEGKGLHIPIKIAWFDQQGKMHGEHLLEIKGSAANFRIPWKDGHKKPILSVNRSFSAPIKIKYVQSVDEKKLLALRETDGQARFDAISSLLTSEIKSRIHPDQTVSCWESVKEVFQSFFTDQHSSPYALSLMSSLPSSNRLLQEQIPFQVEATVAARRSLAKDLAISFLPEWEKLYGELKKIETGSLDTSARRMRAWKNTALYFLLASGEDRFAEMALGDLKVARTMTDAQALLQALCYRPSEYREDALAWWEETWSHNSLVMYKSLTIQCSSESTDTILKIEKILKSRFYDRRIPNSVYAVFKGLMSNPGTLHQLSGRGYEILGEEILELDKLNPQVASRIVGGFNYYSKLAPALKVKARAVLDMLADQENLSSNVREKISNIMKGS